MFNGKEWALKVESPAAGGDQADVESGGVGHHAGQDQLREILLTAAQLNRPEHNSVQTYGSSYTLTWEENQKSNWSW